ncbi:hypothetical protein O4H49_01065 [Kiloniella laminariae]|uniref:ABM domain-containing protein n=1 Tax=Kiloniella laminariae TaxID=454162 RepID=A0ABT4LEJ3_9PROT|nr:hypothetical protein [Kiloniella laminariae]MCZ4279345.1 hypothetical protein [Kiloniella laminariae]
MQAILYRWKLIPSRRTDFITAWREITLALREKTGAFGARLHRCDDGSYLSYALWETLEQRSEAFASGSLPRQVVMQMHHAIQERHPEQTMEITDDLLLPLAEEDPDIFAVLYNWQINPSLLQPFKEIWHRVTLELRSRYRFPGSRLHLGSDGSWIAYAIWPSQEMRDHAFSHPVVAEEEKAVMRSCLVQEQQETKMQLVQDLLHPLPGP